MSTETGYRLLCDAPYCPGAAMAEKLTEMPDGWTRLSSTDHLAGKPAPLVGRGRNRRPVDGWEIGNGAFSLHLCPAHSDAFAEHRPQTVGYPKRSAPSCSCGWSSGSIECTHSAGRKPSLSTEYVWWRHLPEELRWYATRQPKADPTEAQIGAGKEF